ncbi:MAG: ABC transporter ATP-binding protein [Flaviflexus sp.]|nr:ABC transporter ATP-binding protein [Flaviflexus sp.]
MIELDGVTKTFRQGDEEIHALRSCTLSIGPGRFVAIIGPSGSGKSTLLTIMGGLRTPTDGSVSLGGTRLEEAGEKERAKIRFTQVGFILQASSLVPFLTVADQLLLHGKVSGNPASPQRREELLTKLGIADIAAKYPADLSGGQRQRVAIATALIHDPAIILADEPTASLDSERAFEITELLANLTHEFGKTTVMVTHDERLLGYCDEVYRMEDGTLHRA